MSKPNGTQWGVVDIHGTPYHTVAKRIADFRAKYPVESGWRIRTKVLVREPDVVVMRATISDPEGRAVANGYAQEEIGAMAKGMISSVLEVCETSAVGRALAFAGFGGNQSEIASADEMQRRVPENSVSRQKLYKIMRELVAKADDDDAWGVLEIWDELHEDQRLYLMQQAFDRVNLEKVNKCLEVAQTARNEATDPNFIDPLPQKVSEKDARREAVRAAK